MTFDFPSRTRTHYQDKPIRPPSSGPGIGRRLVSHILKYWLLYGFAGLMIWLSLVGKPLEQPVGPKPYQPTPPSAPAYVRPESAPNGEPWPVVAGYVKGYQQLHTNGLSTVTVDNSQNDADVFVKLVSLNGAQAYPVRQFFIPAFGSFTLKTVTAGSYDVRYRDLGSGNLARSEAITLNEVHTNEGTQYSNLTMTLYKVRNGNMRTYGMSEAEF